MRPRPKKNLKARVEKCSYLMEKEPALLKGKWLGEYKELHLEIGCGKGNFICGMAEKNPEIMFIGVECVENVIVTAMEKASEAGLKNVRFICGNARYLGDWFEDGEIARIYLNFSDPWPKSRHEKNRLTSDTFMPLYIKLLKRNGYIFQKTDNRGLFDYSLEVYREFGCALENVTFDLHGEPDYKGLSGNTDNVVTEYEARFVGLGMPICRAEIQMPDKELMAERIKECEAKLAKRNEATEKGKKMIMKRKGEK